LSGEIQIVCGRAGGVPKELPEYVDEFWMKYGLLQPVRVTIYNLSQVIRMYKHHVALKM
jgi:hypothetical protein